MCRMDYMKITKEHYEHLKAALKQVHSEDLQQQYKAMGFSDKRYRWDLTYRARIGQWICDTLYVYMNDDHIDTALRSIIAEIS